MTDNLRSLTAKYEDLEQFHGKHTSTRHGANQDTCLAILYRLYKKVTHFVEKQSHTHKKLL